MEVYNTNIFNPLRNIAESNLHLLFNIPHCCLQKKIGPYLSSYVTINSLKLAKNFKLGLTFKKPTI